ncbi:MAG: ATP-binding cassette domain-containing protein [Actinomycetia bacterium]|nr:ATP-binding cassette domain-containing protein [Actinomycetes bacterium]
MNVVPGSSANGPAGTGRSLSVKGLVKHFGRVKANDGIDVSFSSGEVHALLGENGAGKSTLIKILAGVYHQDSGEILIDGQPVRIDNPSHARRHGIAVVHQHSTLIPRLSVVENVSLQEGGAGPLDRTLAQRLVSTAERLGFELDPSSDVETLTVGDRQRVEIARAFLADARFIILDEPTTILAPTERDALFGLLARLASEAVGVVFVTHHLREAIENSERMTVLRRGTVVGHFKRAAIPSERELVRLMVGELDLAGRSLAQTDAPRTDETTTECIRIAGVSGAPEDGRPLHGLDLSIRRGEVLGIAGVEGNGQQELAALLTGAWAPAVGSIELEGRPLKNVPSGERIKLLGDVPDDHMFATADELTVWENVGLSEMAWWRARTPLNTRFFRQVARERVREFDIRTPSVDGLVGQLSGGNRRRVVIARELSKQLKILVASYPTKGLDVRSAEQVKRWTRELAESGTAVVYMSSELEELIEVSDRIAVLARGRIAGVLATGEATVDTIGALMLGATGVRATGGPEITPSGREDGPDSPSGQS